MKLFEALFNVGATPRGCPNLLRCCPDALFNVGAGIHARYASQFTRYGIVCREVVDNEMKPWYYRA